jgi:NAD(P)-dependent dehydrogenase (short-subunit alcohol dehydrogenase family)
MPPSAELTDKVAVITDATSANGLALAAQVTREGMKVALVDRDRERLAAVLNLVRTKGVPAIAVPADISDLAQVRKLAECIEYELGAPWLVCNSSEMSVELNLQAVTHGVQVFVPGLAKRGEGHIVNLISADRHSATCVAAYAAAMHAIVGLSESLYCERLEALRTLMVVNVGKA